MGAQLEPAELLNRIEIWTEEEVRAKRLPRGTWPLLREAVVAGEFARGKAAELTGYDERQARTVLKQLTERRLLVAAGPKSAVHLAFPVDIVERWLPRLYPTR